MDRQASKLAQSGSVPTDGFVWVLASLCRLHRIPFDPGLILQQFPPPYDLPALLRAAQACGLEAGLAGAPPEELSSLPFPCVGFVRGSEAGNDAGPQAPALLVRADRQHVHFFVPGDEQLRALSIDDFAARYEATVLLAARAEPGPGDVEGAPRESFGFRWFVPELLKHRSIWRDVLLASLAIQVVGLATPLMTQVVIDKVVVHHTHSTLVAIGAGLAMFLVFNAVMGWMRQYLILHTGNRVDAVLAVKVFDHLFRLPLPYFERRPTGTTVARLQGVETIREFVTGASVSLVLDLPFLVVILAVMLFYSWQLTLIAVAIVAVLAAASVIVTPLLRERIDRQFLLGARNQAFVTEYVAAAETVKTLQFEPTLERRYGEYLAGYLAAGFATRNLANTYHSIANALEQLMTLAILLAGALLVMRADGFTIGMLVAFQMFAARMAQPMLRIAGLWQEFQHASIALKRLGDVMDAPAEPCSIVPARAAAAAGRIDLRDVSFRYSDRHPYLYRSLNLHIRPGSLVVVAGPSGCGKSTLAKLLLGFYAPGDGRIEIDGRDLQGMPANELRRRFGVVPQETVLFSGTVHDNLSMAAPHATFGDIVAACAQAGIHDVIEALPQGYQTVIGEHGVGLSGGQKQRIAIGRALLKRPGILVFDEATSNVDQETASSLARTINGLKGAATILFIAHQVPPGLDADDVVTLGAMRQP